MASLSHGSAEAIVRSCDAITRIYMNLLRRSEGPRPETRAVAVLVWFLSSCPWLSVVYLQQRRFETVDVVRGMTSMELAALSMLDWFKEERVQRLVLAAIESLDDPIRC